MIGIYLTKKNHEPDDTPVLIQEGGRLAVIIDADPISSDNLELFINHIKTIGKIITARAYADFRNQSKSAWPKIAALLGVQLVNNYPTNGTWNAADIRLIIDAIDILHTYNPDGFCLVAKDKDFIPLVYRLKESQKTVHLFSLDEPNGELKKACDQSFLVQKDKPLQAEIRTTETSCNKEVLEEHEKDIYEGQEGFEKLCIEAFNSSQDPSGWITLAWLGHIIRKIHPSFQVKNYKFSQLHKLMESCSKRFEMKKSETADMHLVRIIQ